MSENSVYVVNVTKPPSYIKALINSDEEIILVHSKVKLDEKADDSFIPEELKHELSVEQSLLDVTGSPMKYSFDNSAIMCMSILDPRQNNWFKNEEKHYPLTIEQAREFVRDYFSKNSTSKVVWCVCDGLDNNKTVLMSFQQQPNFISRTIVNIHGFLSDKHKEGKINSMYSKHNEIGKSHEKKKESSACYEIYGSPIREVSKDIQTQTKGYVTLEIVEGLHNKIIMCVQALVGHSEATSIAFWQDLLLLELYINTFSQYNKNEQIGDGFWLPTSTSYAISEDPVDLAIKIVHETNHRGKQDKDQNLDIIKIIDNVNNRSSLDITDKLWAVLIHCSTYGKLVDCLNAFVTEIAYNRNRIFIAESNKCFMAEILRGILAGKLAVPTFTGTQPIEILIELGIEKLRKDYVHVFNLGNIADENEINAYFKFESKKDVDANKSVLQSRTQKTVLLMRKTLIVDIEHVGHKMKILGQLETLLEILSLVPSVWLRYTADVALRHFLGKDSPITSFTALINNKMHKLDVALPLNIVQQQILESTPVTFCHTLSSDVPWLKLKSILHQSMLPIFPPCIYKCDPAIENTRDIKDICYFFTSVLQITNFFGKST